MLRATHLRSKAAQYRAAAKMTRDAKTRDKHLSVAKYLDEWAAQAEAKLAPGTQATD
jgi:predicted nucleic acid-binding Zn ribbon protein